MMTDEDIFAKYEGEEVSLAIAALMDEGVAPDDPRRHGTVRLRRYPGERHSTYVACFSRLICMQRVSARTRRWPPTTSRSLSSGDGDGLRERRRQLNCMRTLQES